MEGAVGVSKAGELSEAVDGDTVSSASASTAASAPFGSVAAPATALAQAAEALHHEPPNASCDAPGRF